MRVCVHACVRACACACAFVHVGANRAVAAMRKRLRMAPVGASRSLRRANLGARRGQASVAEVGRSHALVYCNLEFRFRRRRLRSSRRAYHSLALSLSASARGLCSWISPSASVGNVVLTPVMVNVRRHRLGVWDPCHAMPSRHTLLAHVRAYRLGALVHEYLNAPAAPLDANPARR